MNTVGDGISLEAVEVLDCNPYCFVDIQTVKKKQGTNKALIIITVVNIVIGV